MFIPHTCHIYARALVSRLMSRSRLNLATASDTLMRAFDVNDASYDFAARIYAI